MLLLVRDGLAFAKALADKSDDGRAKPGGADLVAVEFPRFDRMRIVSGVWNRRELI
jgi:hypothetical protein